MTGTSRRFYLHNWDSLRIVAALDTVAFHLSARHAIWGFGLPIFLLLSIALGVSKVQPPPTQRFLSRRVARLVVPWLFWSAIMVVLRVAYAALHHQELFEWARWPMVLYGPRIHLWFLPFIVLAGLAAHLVHRVAGQFQALPLAALAAAPLLFLEPRVLGWPFEQWLFSAPAVVLGYAIGRALAFAPSMRRLREWFGIGLALFLAGAWFWWRAFPNTEPALFRFAGALGVLVLAAWLPNVDNRVTRALTPLMLGVYILHPVVYLWCVKPLMCLVACNDIRWLRVVLTFPATMAVVWGLRRTRLVAVL